MNRTILTVLTLFVALLTACSLGTTLTGTPMPDATAAPAVTPLAPAATAQPASAWEAVAPGVERREYEPDGNDLSEIIAVRLDPAQVTFRAQYRPGAPLGLSDWIAALPGALAIINSNFFTQENTITGLLVSDGVVFGSAYTDRGGTFRVMNGVPEVVANLRQPYRGEPLEQAVQAFPLLVLDGQAAYTTTRGDTITRRSAIAQDSSGRIILLSTPTFGLRLADLSRFLADSDMEIITAFNLDGGGSTMLYVGADGYRINSFDAVPAVLAVYPRG